MNSDARNGCSHPLGFPIRKSPDHSLLAASRGLSQLTTSFFAYLRLGIHTHALSSLTITSTSNTHGHWLLPAPNFKGTSPDQHAAIMNAIIFYALSTCVTTLPAHFQGPGCFINARQYSIVKDLDCLNNRQNLSVLRIADYCFRVLWWAQVESNHRPHPYQGCALAI